MFGFSRSIRRPGGPWRVKKRSGRCVECGVDAERQLEAALQDSGRRGRRREVAPQAGLSTGAAWWRYDQFDDCLFRSNVTKSCRSFSDGELWKHEGADRGQESNRGG